jgi:hypothetical protein
VGTYPNAHCNVVSTRKSQQQIRNFQTAGTHSYRVTLPKVLPLFIPSCRSIIHALAFCRLSSKTSQVFFAILRPTFIQRGPFLAHCQIFDNGMTILRSRTDLSCSVNTLPCQRFAPIVYQAPLLVQHFQSAKSTPNAHTIFIEGPVQCNSLPYMSESPRYSCLRQNIFPPRSALSSVFHFITLIISG